MTDTTHLSTSGERGHFMRRFALTNAHGRIRSVVGGRAEVAQLNLQPNERAIGVPTGTTPHRHYIVDRHAMERPSLGVVLPTKWPMRAALVLALPPRTALHIDGRLELIADDAPTQIEFAHAGRYHLWIDAWPHLDIRGTIESI